MGHKVHPTGFRLIVNRNWQSQWMPKNGKFKEGLKQDLMIRKTVKKMFPSVPISSINIEHFAQSVRVILHTSNPGMLVSKKKSSIDDLNKALIKLMPKFKVFIKVIEVKTPECSAANISESIAQQLSSRSSYPYKKVIKMALSSAMMSGAKGIKITCGGRLAGAEIARTEHSRAGRVPLHTMRANIDYASRTARTMYGAIGVKVWVYKGLLNVKDSVNRGV